MDADRFDQLARSLTAVATRRGITRALGGLSLTGLFAPLLGFTEAVAKKKHKKKKKKCKGGTRKCGKKCIAATSCCTTADCGTGGACASGACLCATGFKSCQGSCIADDACCTADCGPCESCQGAACVSACQADQECVSGQCQCTTNSCDGCCDVDTCRNGASTAFCGIDGEVCDACTGNEVCQSGDCVCIPDCAGKVCGDNGCGGSCGSCTGGRTCQSGTCVCTLECCGSGDCPPGDTCAQNQCVTGQGTCSTGADECLGGIVSCNSNAECFCTTATSGETRCGFGFEVGCDACTTDAQCAAAAPGIPAIFCAQGGGANCCTGFCVRPCPS